MTGFGYNINGFGADYTRVEYYEASGGTTTTDGDYKYHTFTGSGTFTISVAGNAAGGTIDYMVTAGGGGSGIDNSGGGGAGGMVRVTGATKSAAAYSIVIGAGGAGAINEMSFSLAKTPGEINVSAMFI